MTVSSSVTTSPRSRSGSSWPITTSRARHRADPGRRRRGTGHHLADGERVEPLPQAGALDLLEPVVDELLHLRVLLRRPDAVGLLREGGPHDLDVGGLARVAQEDPLVEHVRLGPTLLDGLQAG